MSRSEGRLHERHAWVLAFVMGLLLVVFGAAYVWMGAQDPPHVEAALEGGGVATGPLLRDAPPELAVIVGQVARSWGIYEAAFGAMVMALAAFGLRRRQRWAWFALWLLPAALLAEMANVIAAGYRVGPTPAFVAVAVLSLVLSARLVLGRERTVR